MKVIPPNFGYVEEGIFRCGAPEPRHYGFLASLGLRTCILLTDTHDGAFVHWLQETGVLIFYPLSNETQARGGFVRGGGGPQVYSTMGVGDNMSFAQGTRSGGGGREGATAGGAQSINNNNAMSRDDGREDPPLPNSGFGDNFGPSNSIYHTLNDGADVGDTGGYDGSGHYMGEDGMSNAAAAAATTNNSINLNNINGNGGGWVGSARGTFNGTSNAVRFLQENVAGRQMSTKFSPVLVQEPVYFPGGGGGRGDNANGGGPPYLFASAPSYEGRLHGLMTLSEAVVVGILHIMLDPRYYPLLITCSKGRYRSGIVCGCLRKLQGWNLVSILEEYRRFAGNKSRADNEEFIELFDEELVNLELPDGRRPTILYNT
jgi:hypothetical protein